MNSEIDYWKMFLRITIFCLSVFAVVFFVSEFATSCKEEVRQSKAEYKRKMQQCLDDGYKEYYCEAVMRKCESNSVPVPIVMPMRIK